MPSTRARLAVLAAAVAILWGTPVLAQETVFVRVKLIQGEIPTDPMAPIWNTIPATEFPMSPQVHWPKRILQVTVKSIKVRGGIGGGPGRVGVLPQEGGQVGGVAAPGLERRVGDPQDAVWPR